jgi:hypothetical protein
MLLVLVVPVLAACTANPTPGALPTTSAPVTSSVSPTATATPAPTGTVVSSRVAYPWRWPNLDNPATVTHTYPVPPVAQLVAIDVGSHPHDSADRPYERISFSFTTGFPSYRFEYVDSLVADPGGRAIALDGDRVLRIVFNPAQAHSDDGRPSVATQPPAHLGLTRMVAYAQSGDFEGYVSYGIGITGPNAQIQVRAYEVTSVNAQGQQRYVVALDVDAS